MEDACLAYAAVELTGNKKCLEELALDEQKMILLQAVSAPS
jgi:hypothetical protein